MVLGVRFGDRIGKGLRTSPRDALLADSAPPGERGKSFGLHRAMDTFGAFLGLVIMAVIVYLSQGGGLTLNLKTYRWLVVVGVIPAVLAGGAARGAGQGKKAIFASSMRAGCHSKVRAVPQPGHSLQALSGHYGAIHPG